MRIFIERNDLTPEMAPSQEWLKRNSLSGILLIEVPSKSEFEAFVNKIAPEADRNINVAHAEFQRELSITTVTNSSSAFDEIFQLFHEEVFIEIASGLRRFVIWIPSEHKFYGIFGDADCLRAEFGETLAALKAEIINFAGEPFFNERTRHYILSAVATYFTM